MFKFGFAVRRLCLRSLLVDWPVDEIQVSHWLILKDPWSQLLWSLQHRVNIRTHHIPTYQRDTNFSVMFGWFLFSMIFWIWTLLKVIMKMLQLLNSFFIFINKAESVVAVLMLYKNNHPISCTNIVEVISVIFFKEYV